MICEKCGFDYTGEKCPVCEANYEVTVEKASKSPLGLIGMIMGLASFLYIGWPLAAAGLILSIFGKKKCPTDGLATAGLISSIISLAWNILSMVSAAVMTFVLVIIYVIFYALLFGAMAVSGGY